MSVFKSNFELRDIPYEDPILGITVALSGQGWIEYEADGDERTLSAIDYILKETAVNCIGLLSGEGVSYDRIYQEGQAVLDVLKQLVGNIDGTDALKAVNHFGIKELYPAVTDYPQIIEARKRKGGFSGQNSIQEDRSKQRAQILDRMSQSEKFFAAPIADGQRYFFTDGFRFFTDTDAYQYSLKPVNIDGLLKQTIEIYKDRHIIIEVNVVDLENNCRENEKHLSVFREQGKVLGVRTSYLLDMIYWTGNNIICISALDNKFIDKNVYKGIIIPWSEELEASCEFSCGVLPINVNA